MSKKDEALKLALECIEAWDRGGNASDYWRDRFDAITAIRAALAEQPAQQPVSVTDELVEAYCWAWAQSFVTNNPYHTVKMTTEDRKHIAAGLRAALADQPAQQQEPVAWMDEFGNVFPLSAQRGPRYLNEPMKPLYTSPPASKPWVGLTDEQIQAFAFEAVKDNWDWLKFARAIEAKLREKNK